MNSKQLLSVSAALEAAIGLSLATVPALPVSILLGSSLGTAAGSIVARVAGVALLSLAIACWLARSDEQSRAANGVICAMLLYNTATAILLIYAAVGLKLVGLLLWPTVLLHAAMAIWCVTSIRFR